MADALTVRRTPRLPREVRRSQLLESARQVFTAIGYHAASMDDIALRAGVSKPVLYQHFDSKLTLYLALLEDACGQLVARVQRALDSSTDNEQRVRATAEALFTYVADPTAAFRLVFESDLTSSIDVRERLDNVTLACATPIAEAIAAEAGVDTGAARVLAVALVGMCHVSARFWLERESGVPQVEATRLVAQLAWEGVRGLAPRRGAGS